VILWAGMCLFCVCVWIIDTYLIKRKLEVYPAWDLAQIFAVLLWMRPTWHGTLATLSLLGAEPDNTKSSDTASRESSTFSTSINELYACCFEMPEIEEETDTRGFVLVRRPDGLFEKADLREKDRPVPMKMAMTFDEQQSMN